jgi:hypothetical protein
MDDEAMMPADFPYERFRALSGSDLVDFMEPLVNSPSIRVPPDVRHKVLSDLQDDDEEHLVYALELLGYNAPESIVPHLPRFLSHRHGSVRCAVDRILRHLPDEWITHELVDSVRSALASYPPDLVPGREFFASLVEELQRRRAGMKSGEAHD